MAQPAIGGGGVASLYDFRASAGAQRPHLRTLARMHEVLADRFGPSLSRLMRCEVEVDLVAIELATFDEYVRSMPTPTVAGTFAMLPLEGHAIVELNPQLAVVMLERLLGGMGSLPMLRRLTDIEGAVLTDVIESIGDGLTATFDPLIEVSPRFSEYVYDPEFLDAADPNDTVVLLAFQVRLHLPGGETDGIITLCYPTGLIAPVLRQLAATDQGESEQAAIESGPMADLLPEVAVELRVALLPTQMTARDVAGLQPGDVLRLDHRLDDLAEARVGDATIFLGHIGQRGPRLAIQAVQLRQMPTALEAAFDPKAAAGGDAGAQPGAPIQEVGP